MGERRVRHATGVAAIDTWRCALVNREDACANFRESAAFAGGFKHHLGEVVAAVAIALGDNSIDLVGDDGTGIGDHELAKGVDGDELGDLHVAVADAADLAVLEAAWWW